MIQRSEVVKANVEIHDFYSKNHDFSVSYIRRRNCANYYFEMLLEAIKRHGLQIANSRILEIGCGTGTFTRKILENKASELTLVDISPGMIDQAKRKLKNEKIVYLVSSLEELKTKTDGKFDIIFSTSFLHHLYDLDEGIGCIKDLLSPNGVYIALHEPILDRKVSLVEKIDAYLERFEASLKYNLQGNNYWTGFHLIFIKYIKYWQILA